MTEFHEGDILTLKKKHPCGGYDWTLLRSGADLRLQCNTCGRTVMLPRAEVERRLKVRRSPATEPDQTDNTNLRKK